MGQMNFSMRRVLILACWLALVLAAGCSMAEAAGGASEPQTHKKSCEAGKNTNAQTASARTVRVDFMEGTTTDERELAKDLRRGGYVILVQYAEGRHDRSLSPENRAKANKLGDALCKLGAPIGRVVASPGVQAKGAAEATFGRERIEVDRSLVWSSGVPQADELESGLRELLSEIPSRGENVVLVASVVDAAQETGGEVTILKPLGKGNFQRVGTF